MEWIPIIKNKMKITLFWRRRTKLVMQYEMNGETKYLIYRLISKKRVNKKSKLSNSNPKMYVFINF